MRLSRIFEFLRVSVKDVSYLNLMPCVKRIYIAIIFYRKTGVRLNQNVVQYLPANHLLTIYLQVPPLQGKMKPTSNGCLLQVLHKVHLL